MGSKQPTTIGGMKLAKAAPLWRKILSGSAAQFGAGVVALALIAATCAALFWPQTPATRPEAGTLPIAPAPQPTGPAAAVTMVPAPYEPALPLPTVEGAQSDSSGPVPPESGATAGEAAKAPSPPPAHPEARAPARAAPPAAAPAPAPARVQAKQPEEAPARVKPLPPAAPVRSDKEKADKAEKASEDKIAKAVIMDDAPAPKLTTAGAQ